MKSAKLIFGDNSSVVINTSSKIFGIRVSDNSAFYGSDDLNRKYHIMYPLSASEYPFLELDIHTDAGILPSIVELLENYPYFYLEENNRLIYSSKSVLRIELVD